MSIDIFLTILVLAILLARYVPIFKNGEENMTVNFDAVKKEYGTDLTKEIEGQWFNLSLIDGAKVKVARSGNPEYEKLLRKLYKPYSQQIRRGKELSKSVQDEIELKLLTETVLMDWSGIPDGEGGEIPYSKENARAMLGDPALKELKDEISDFSNDFAKFQAEQDEELEKN